MTTSYNTSDRKAIYRALQELYDNVIPPVAGDGTGMTSSTLLRSRADALRREGLSVAAIEAGSARMARENRYWPALADHLAACREAERPADDARSLPGLSPDHGRPAEVRIAIQHGIGESDVWMAMSRLMEQGWRRPQMLEALHGPGGAKVVASALGREPARRQHYATDETFEARLRRVCDMEPVGLAGIHPVDWGRVMDEHKRGRLSDEDFRQAMDNLRAGRPPFRRITGTDTAAEHVDRVTKGTTP